LDSIPVACNLIQYFHLKGPSFPQNQFIPSNDPPNFNAFGNDAKVYFKGPLVAWNVSKSI
jgi:hypothetical protein